MHSQNLSLSKLGHGPNQCIFSFFFLRLEAVRIETRGERKEFARTLMAKGMVHIK